MNDDTPPHGIERPDVLGADLARIRAMLHADADIETLIQRPALGDNAGLIGAVTLARQNLKEPAWSG